MSNCELDFNFENNCSLVSTFLLLQVLVYKICLLLQALSLTNSRQVHNNFKSLVSYATAKLHIIIYTLYIICVTASYNDNILQILEANNYHNQKDETGRIIFKFY